MNQQVPQKRSIFDRPGDTREYRVWVKCSTIKLRWEDMNLWQKLMQIDKERREAANNLPDSIA